MNSESRKKELPQHISKHILRELAQRSSTSIIAIPILFLTAIFSTGIMKQKPVVISILGFILLTLTTLRIVQTLKIKHSDLKDDRGEKLTFTIMTILSGLDWGIFQYYFLHVYMIGWQSSIVLIMSCGIISVSISSLAPDLKISRWYMFTILSPIIIWSFTVHTYVSLIFGFVTFVYLMTVFIAANKNNNWFIESTTTNELVKRQTSDLQVLLKALTGDADQFTNSSEVFLNLSTKLSKNSETIFDKSTSVNNSAKQLSDTISTISQNLISTSNDFKDISSAIGNISSTINHITAETTSTNYLSQQAVNQSTNVANKISNLLQISSKIQEFSKRISKISLHTKILSLNARIEATQTKESAGGFTVVADEIKKLAEQSKNETNEIRSQIEEIHLSITTMTEEIQKIIDFIQDINRVLSNINGSMLQQSGVTETMAQKISAISGVVLDITDRIAQSSSGAAAIASDISDVQTAIGAISSDCHSIEKSSRELLNLASLLRNRSHDTMYN